MFYAKLSDVQATLLRQIVDEFPKAFQRCYFGDNNILLGKTLSYFEEPRFIDALLRQSKDQQERALGIRLNTLVWAFDNALNLEGDIVECGVWKGFSFAFLTDYFDFAGIDRTLWLYDTFAGIPEGYDDPGKDHEAFHAPGLYEGVVKRFSPYPNVRVVKGALPGSLEGNSPEKIALLHLDMNSARGEVETLDALFERIVPGGMIVFDDYGWLMYREQLEAEKAWAARRGYRILEMSNGQGLLVKR